MIALPPSAVVLGVDLGKTSCRLRLSHLVDDGTRLEHIGDASGPGAPGLADVDGPHRARLAIAYTLSQFTPAQRASITHIGIGAAGVEATSPESIETFLKAVREQITGVPSASKMDDGFATGEHGSAFTFNDEASSGDELGHPLDIALITDALAAHVGAFNGGAGTLLIVGTGSVVFRLTTDGPITEEQANAATQQIDGWGPWLGDEGSGRWIGQEGLKAVLRAHDGRGPATALSEAAATLVGSASDLPRWVSASGSPARQLGRFAPHVFHAADAGDAVAMEIVERAATHLASTAAASFGPESLTGAPNTICVLGGVTTHPRFTELMEPRLAAYNIAIGAPVGDQLDGAALIALRRNLPVESKVHRG